MVDKRVTSALQLHHEQAAARRERNAARKGLSAAEIFLRINAVPLPELAHAPRPAPRRPTPVLPRPYSRALRVSTP